MMIKIKKIRFNIIGLIFLKFLDFYCFPLSLIILFLFVSLVFADQLPLARIMVDTFQRGKPLRQVWTYFGFDECNFAPSPEAKQLMTTLVASQAETVYIRCHFLLNTGDGKPALKWGSTNVYTEDELGRPVFDWTIMDAIMDAIVQSGCRPLVEIGFMPKALSVKPEPYQHVYPPDLWAGWAYPPKDYEKWATLIREWARHSRERYGPEIEKTWLWELWNEPDIFYWQGSFEEYVKLYETTEKALHEILPGAILGAPHTTSPSYAKPKEFLFNFLRHCETAKVRLYYIGFHSKGRTQFVDGHPRLDLALNLINNKAGFDIVASFPEFKNKPIIIGECDPEGMAALPASVNPANGYRNGSAYAAYEVALMKHTLDLADRAGVNLKGVLTWAFLFLGRDYFEGFRTLATNGIHKPVVNAFKMLGRLRGQRLVVKSDAALGVERIMKEKVRGEPDIDGLATATSESTQIVIWNYHDDVAPAPPASITLEVIPPAKDIKKALVSHFRIDDHHSNAYTVWLEMGSPKAPSPAQKEALRKAMELEYLEPPSYSDLKDGILTLNFELPRHAVSLIEIIWIRSLDSGW